MPASWNKEALKAQAISARNYAIKNLNKYKSLGFDLCTTQNSQVYGGVDAEHVDTNKAVDETRGILAYHSGNVADLFYHSSSGGKTENSENIWSNAVPYLRGVEDPYSLGSPNDYWEYKISKSEIENLLRSKGKNIGNFLGIRIDKISENERILKLTFVGDSGETTIEKEAIRGLFGYSNLKSNWFTINSQNTKNTQSIVSDSYIAALNDLQLFLNKSESNKINGYSNLSNNDIITSQDYLFQGKGYGHGLGMSQYGAKKMAEQGYTFDEILKYYFKGIDVY
ncbi:SpoIID/LytB domain precursor (fragment) [Acetoanaerobium sticklandii]|uniref:SpoIID/LytB domain n=2 Tax=Acetoanaerobium sticklandii TaxID=1511 RepID=E3PRD0_ACESD